MDKHMREVMKQRDPQIHVRIPQSMKDTLEANAKANCRSVNSEIVYGLKFYAQHFEQTEKALGTAVGSQPNAPQK